MGHKDTLEEQERLKPNKMREIKYNVWDNKNKRMFREAFELTKKGWEIWVQFERESSDDLIWLQYTGLNDKNGKEIYEGDIISTHREFYFDEDHSVDEDLKGEVVLIASKGACLKKPRYKCNLSGENGIRNQYYNFSAYRSKVIGNIHENPELIKD